MNKRLSIAIAFVISLFIAVNAFLLFSDQSKIQKSVYVPTYERMTAGTYEEQIAKEGLVAPAELFTVYVGNEETIDTWLVKEGDRVEIGDELAYLQSERAESQMAAWEAEEEGLLDQMRSVENTLAELQSERSSAGRNNGTNFNTTESPDGQEVELNVNVQVDVQQDGAYAQAIAAAEQELAEIDRKLTVVQTQLSQPSARAALVSPVDGIVSSVNRHGSIVSADLFSEQKEIITYADVKEWQKIEVGDEVLIQQDGMETPLEANVLSVSEVPAPDSEWKRAYTELNSKKEKNPLEFYEIRVAIQSEETTIPFGANVNTFIVVNEAQDAVAIKQSWLTNVNRQTATAFKIDENGNAIPVQLTVPFLYHDRAVISDGLAIGDVALDEKNLRDYAGPTKVFLPMPLDWPSKTAWKSFGWKNYVKYMFIE
ncbi:efflux RND transporter periplasmic adaptor subunit [Sporosarcina sp. Te-1]|uniref:efflux RND transporter periplasmic adaptor subunit n=1 Tax=Sporosarcina sp. Te-1 TaxID=2818390 RepID=UPI001A9E2020|nr:efflux RND transporter periplasmic adaptor subunit [Sporosarcina sp. Te-1]QTD40789.1 efflux RND transporter periplasmic adaptor subunit [Sporosarcina sp. Te-1]